MQFPARTVVKFPGIYFVGIFGECLLFSKFLKFMGNFKFIYYYHQVEIVPEQLFISFLNKLREKMHVFLQVSLKVMNEKICPLGYTNLLFIF